MGVGVGGCARVASVLVASSDGESPDAFKMQFREEGQEGVGG